jgi:hypothetical protein
MAFAPFAFDFAPFEKGGGTTPDLLTESSS